jgi:glycosyltransferase involved in cell wall biosynthesis
MDIKRILSQHNNDYSNLEKSFKDKYNREFIFDNVLFEELTDNTPSLSASVVIPAWKAEDTIVQTLTAIEKSSFNQKFPQKLQVVVSDDGSTDNTFSLIKDSGLNLNLVVVRQDNYSQGPAMNAGISAAEGDIVIEVDADTVLNFSSLENLMVRHEFQKDLLLTGFRHYVQPDDERVSLEYLKKNGPDAGFYITNDERIEYFEPGYPSNMCLASNHYKRLGNFNGLWMPDNNAFHDPWLLADMVFGMLFSAPREYFNLVGGFDDRFEGWGCDDGYVGAKLISEGLQVIPVYAATGLHISHPFRTQDKQAEYDFNRKFFFEFINATDYSGHPDWIAKAKTRIKEKHVLKSRSNIKHDIQKKPQSMTVQQLLSVGKYQKAIDLMNDQSQINSFYFATALFGLHKYKEAISYLEINSLEQIDDRSSVLLACCYAAMGKFDDARRILDTIEQLNPEFPELQYWLHRDLSITLRQGIKYFEQNFYDVALRCFESCLILDPESAEAQNLREICLEKIETK